MYVFTYFLDPDWCRRRSQGTDWSADGNDSDYIVYMFNNLTNLTIWCFKMTPNLFSDYSNGRIQGPGNFEVRKRHLQVRKRYLEVRKRYSQNSRGA